jgi:hypothetical protein
MEATFGTYLHDWTKHKGKEKKAPELVHFWNSKLANEIEVETDLYLQHLVLQNKDNSSFILPCLDYANGFDTKGVTVLFGGDHGDNHCPINCKLNLSPPEERKKRQDLGYQCPVVCFASVACSKDVFELIIASTAMPTVKEQLQELQRSTLITIYHKLNMNGCFRSYIVPSTIQFETVAFLPQTNNTDDGSIKKCMTFAYHGGQEQGVLFGSLIIDDPLFSEIPSTSLQLT